MGLINKKIKVMKCKWDRIETKFTNYVMPIAGELRLNSAGENKRDGFDFMRVH
jgi:hypothetical protein